MKIVIAMGGTGGHIYPGMVLADQLIEKGNEVIIISRQGGIGQNILKEKKYNVINITGQGLKRKLSFALIVFLLKLKIGFLQSIALMIKLKPDVVIGMGGYLTPPVVLAAKVCGIPCIVHEQNVLPGLSVRLLSGIADKVAVSFEETKAYLKTKNVVVTGNFVRQSIYECSREEGMKQLELSGSLITVLVFGGSQGASTINYSMVEALKYLTPVRGGLQIIHITGLGQFSKIQEEYRKYDYNYKIFPYLHTMEYAYACADLVISRSGATTVSEIIARKLPSILIPYPHATANHQLLNAKVISDKGGGEILKDEELNGEILADKIIKILKDKKELQTMKTNMEKIFPSQDISLFTSIVYNLVKPAKNLNTC